MDISSAEQALQLVFADKTLLQRALTHRSYLNENPDYAYEDNERLEFLGDAVLDFLEQKNDLGVHTEMFSDGLVDLFEAGVVTNEKKTLHRGKIVTSFVIGTRRAFDFVDNNPFMEFHPNEYVNDPYVVARNDKMVAINSALAVDLSGQVLDSFWPREVPTLQRGYGLEPLAIDKEADNRTRWLHYGVPKSPMQRIRRYLQLGELLHPGEVVLAPGESY